MALLETIKAALLARIKWEEISILAPEELWRNDPAQAAIYAFARSGLLDADDYLARYTDVAQAGVDPITHFFKNGIFEERYILLKNSQLRISLNDKPDNVSDEIQSEASMHKPINVIYITDDNYYLPTLVSIYSLYIHRNENATYNICILAVNVHERHQQILNKLNACRFTVNIINRVNEFDNFKFKQKDFHVSTCALFKMYIAEIFPNLDKALYLDSDTIIVDDLVDLYNTDINELYAGVIVDLKATYVYKVPAHTKIGLNCAYYFNSGVMLLNLSKLRKDCVSKQMIDYRKNGINFFMDQDTLNFAFNKSTKQLSYEYNLMLNHLDYINFADFVKYIRCVKKYKDKNEIICDAKILHFSAAGKPWNNASINHAHIWLAYYRGLLAFAGLDLPLAYSKEQFAYWIRQYYYSENEIKHFPGYSDSYISGKSIIRKRNINLNSRHADWHPICLSPYVCDALVTLTTTSERFPHIFPTLYSLVNQRLRPKAILLWLAEDEFGGRPSVPRHIHDLGEYGLQIRFLKRSLKVYNKLLPALKECEGEILVTCDDDIFYEKDWLKTLYESWQGDKTCVHSLRAREMRIDGQGKPVTYRAQKLANKNAAGFEYLATGVGGVLYPPGCLHGDVLDDQKFMALSPYADDLWYWAMSCLAGWKTRSIKPKNMELIYTNPERELFGKTLSRINVDEKANDKQLDNLLNAYPCLIACMKR